MTRSSSPGFSTVCQTLAGTYSACPAATGTSPDSSRITPLPPTMKASSSTSCDRSAVEVPGLNTE